MGQRRRIREWALRLQAVRAREQIHEIRHRSRLALLLSADSANPSAHQQIRKILERDSPIQLATQSISQSVGNNLPRLKDRRRFDPMPQCDVIVLDNPVLALVADFFAKKRFEEPSFLALAKVLFRIQ